MKKLLLLSLLSFVPAIVSAADGFLFVTFKGESTPLTEQIYFATSKDGRTWEALNKGDPVLVSKLGDKGVRDPYLLRAHDGKKFYLIATDLSINLNHDWKRAAQAASQSIVIWESTDLVKWSEPRLVKVAPDDAGCAWAPEAIYDEDTGDYLVFWASLTKRDNFDKFRIWAARTKDFMKFGEPFIYIEKTTTLIDTTIVRDGHRYFRFTKDERIKNITLEVSDKLTGTWKEINDTSIAKLIGYEGPECYLIEPASEGKPPTWGLILDQYSKQAGYQPFTTHDLASGQFTPGTGFTFPFRFRHGSVVPISTEEYSRIQQAYGSR